MHSVPGSGGIAWLHRWALTRDADRSMFRGEPTTPEWVEEAAGLGESLRGGTETGAETDSPYIAIQQ